MNYSGFKAIVSRFWAAEIDKKTVAERWRSEQKLQGINIEEVANVERKGVARNFRAQGSGRSRFSLWDRLRGKMRGLFT
jgi:hypothetical protein